MEVIFIDWNTCETGPLQEKGKSENCTEVSHQNRVKPKIKQNKTLNNNNGKNLKAVGENGDVL